MACHHLNFLFVAALILLSACADNSPSARRAENADWFINTLGPVVTWYEQKHGELPEDFETALFESNLSVPWRGDVYGNAFEYKKTGSGSCYFGTLHPDPDEILITDVVVEYENGLWRVVAP